MWEINETMVLKFHLFLYLWPYMVLTQTCFGLNHKYSGQYNLKMGLNVLFHTGFWNPCQCHHMGRAGLAYGMIRIREPRYPTTPADTLHHNHQTCEQVYLTPVSPRQPAKWPNGLRHMSEPRWGQESGLNQKKAHPAVLQVIKWLSHWDFGVAL